MRTLITTLLAGASLVAMAAIAPTPANAAPARYQLQNAKNPATCLSSYNGTVGAQACLPAHAGLSYTHWVVDAQTDIQYIVHPLSPESDRCLDTNVTAIYMSPCTRFDYGTRWLLELNTTAGHFLLRAYDGKVLTRWDDGKVALAWMSDVDDPRKYQWKPVF